MGHRKSIHRGKKVVPNAPSHVQDEELTLNLNEQRLQELSSIFVEIRGISCRILLDSCSSCNIISLELLTEYLGIPREEIDRSGPVVSVRGIGGAITQGIGRITLEVDVLGNTYEETFNVLEEPGIPGGILLSARGMGRCGVIVDHRRRVAVSADSAREVPFCSDELSFPVKQAILPEEQESGRKIVDGADCTPLVSKNQKRKNRLRRRNRRKCSALQRKLKANNGSNENNENTAPEQVPAEEKKPSASSERQILGSERPVVTVGVEEDCQEELREQILISQTQEIPESKAK